MKNLVFLILLIVFLSFTNLALAATITLPNPLCLGGPGSPGCVDSFAVLIEKITDYILTVIEILAVLMFVWAGILFVTSGGNPGQITKARNALMYAVIGAIIALAGKGLIVVIKAVIGVPP